MAAKTDDEKKEAKRLWRINNREKCRTAARKWKAENPEKVREYKRKDHEKNGDAHREKYREYSKKNKEKRDTYARQRHAANKDEINRKRREQKGVQRAANPDQFREAQKKHKMLNPASWRLYGTRKSAKAKGIECDLDKEWFETRLAAGVCEISGLPFDDGKRTPNSPSIDRINPKGPYTKANCRMILWWINRALSDQGEDYAIAVFEAIIAMRNAASRKAA